jgi:hypothetical protein
VTTSKCNGCPRMIEWAKTKNGKNIPLERLASYRVDADGFAIPAGDVLVSHFKTCPKANDFSGRSK